jgi:hypothetical protein
VPDAFVITSFVPEGPQDAPVTALRVCFSHALVALGGASAPVPHSISSAFTVLPEPPTAPTFRFSSPTELTLSWVYPLPNATRYTVHISHALQAQGSSGGSGRLVGGRVFVFETRRPSIAAARLAQPLLSISRHACTRPGDASPVEAVALTFDAGLRQGALLPRVIALVTARGSGDTAYSENVLLELLDARGSKAIESLAAAVIAGTLADSATGSSVAAVATLETSVALVPLDDDGPIKPHRRGAVTDDASTTIEVGDTHC